MYDYRVVGIAKTIDGDTFDLDLDLGFYAVLRVRVRLVEVDTYEVYGTNAHELGVEARDLARDWMMLRLSTNTLSVITFPLTPSTPVGDGSFGRWLGDVYDFETSERLVDVLREAGYVESDWAVSEG